MAKYDSFSGGNGGNKRGYAVSINTSPYTKMDGDLERIFQGSNDYGQSIAVLYENGAIVDGILGKRVDKTQYKIFSWGDAPVIMDETLSCDDLPPVLTAGRNNFKYEILAARLEGDEEEGYEDDAAILAVDHDGEVPEVEGTGPIPLSTIFTDDTGEPDARFSVWESSANSGPSSSAKSTTSVLTVEGKDAILKPDEKFNWLQQGVTLRPELEGLSVTYGKVEKQSNRKNDSGDYYTFHHPAWVMADGNPVMPDNEGQQQAETQPEVEAVTDGGEAETDASDGDVGGVDEFVATCVNLNLDTDPAIRGLFEDMADDDQYPDLTTDTVDDVDALVEQVQDAVEAKSLAA